MLATGVSLVAVALLSGSPEVCWAEESERGRAGIGTAPLTLFSSTPHFANIVELPDEYTIVTITDVEVGDLNGDGRPDLAVLWFASHQSGPTAHMRRLTLLYSDGTEFRRGPEFDLYEYDPDDPFEAIFFNGTSELCLGDFDGDGDLDMAAAAFYGDELYFIENADEGFTTHLRFPFGINSSATFLTPPEMLAVDLTGDGRDELVVVSDPIVHINAEVIHFWTTDSDVEFMYRPMWEPNPADVLFVQWTRAIGAADFDGDGIADLCLTGSVNPPAEDDPVLSIWYGLEPQSQGFQVYNAFPDFLCSDVVAFDFGHPCGPGVALVNLDGTVVQYWAGMCGPDVGLEPVADVWGFPGSPDRGMTGVAGDVDGDGDADLITKQKRGDVYDPRQIDVVLASNNGSDWTRLEPAPFDTIGLSNFYAAPHLRPRNLAVADVFGNVLPEVISGFEAREIEQPDGSVTLSLDVVYWMNSTVGDVDRDGDTDIADQGLLELALGTCQGVVPDRLLGLGNRIAEYNPDADLDKDGCVNSFDLAVLEADLGARCCVPDQYVGDCNCDGIIDLMDVNPFVVALEGVGEYYALAPYCNWLNADANLDGTVNFSDVNAFIDLLK